MPAAQRQRLERLVVAGADDAVGARIGDRERHRVAGDARDVDFAPHVAHVLVDLRRAARQAGRDFALEVQRDFVARRTDRGRGRRVTKPPPPCVDWNAPSSSATADQTVAVEVAAGGLARRARHERVAQLREADRVLLVGQGVGRVPARLADEALDHRAVVAAQVVGEAELRRERGGVGDGRRRARRCARRTTRSARVGPAGERRDAVRRQRLIRPLILVVLDAHAEVQGQAVGDLPGVVDPAGGVDDVVDAGDRRVVDVDLVSVQPPPWCCRGTRCRTADR